MIVMIANKYYMCVYFQLWEQAQMDNSRLRDDLARTRDELSAAKKKLETMVQVCLPYYLLILYQDVFIMLFLTDSVNDQWTH